MAPQDFYENKSGSIRRIPGGYVLTVFLAKGVNRDMMILITDDGAVIGFDGTPIVESDVLLIEVLLPHVGGAAVAWQLYPGGINPGAIATAKAQLAAITAR